MSKIVSPILGLALLGLVPTLAMAQTASILPNARTQFIDANGQPVVGGTVTFYIPSTTTPKTTWQDSGETTPNSNPVTLDGLGSALIWGDGSYREIVKDSSGNVIWDALTASASDGGSGVTSLNSQTGAVNIVGGSGITVSASGGNITLTSSGGNVNQAATISNLRALTSAAIPVVVVQNYTTLGDYGGGVFTYNPSDTTTTDNSCTIFVDAGSHRWYRQTGNVPVDVRWCGATGNGSTDDTTALQHAVAVGPSVYVPAGNYKTSASLALHPSESLIGAGLNLTTITGVKNGTPYPLITTTAVTTSPSPNGACDASSNYVYSLCNIIVSNLKLNTSGVTPVAGDDGISFTQYTDNSTISNVYVENQWNGITLGPADASYVNNVFSTSNYNNGLDISNSTYSSLQWNLNTVFLTNNELDGLYSHVNVGSGFVGLYVFGSATLPLTQVTLGTWTNINTFGNAGFGVGVTGNATGPIPSQGVRIVKGFFGQDGSDEIYLDTYNTGGGALVIEPDYIELAGTGPTGRTLSHPISGQGSGVHTTASVGPLIVRGGVIKQNSLDGIISNGSSLLVDGGVITDNGVPVPASTMVNGFSYTIQSVGSTSFTSFGASANTVGVVFTKTGSPASGTGTVSTTARSNGVNIASGAANGVAINGIQAGNTSGNTSQLYGVASDEDFIAISGSNLLNNTTAPVTGTAMANSVASGNLPISINTGGGGSYCALSGCIMTGNINMNGNSLTGAATVVASGNISTTAGGLFASAGGVVGKDIDATRSMAVGTAVDAVTGDLLVATSLGVGVAASTVTGDIAASNAIIVGTPTGSYQSGSLNAATAVLVNNVGIAVGSYCALTGCTMSGPLIVNSTLEANSIGIDQTPSATVGTITGPSGGLAFSGGVNVNFTGSTATTGTIATTTGFYGSGTASVSGVTTVTASGQVQGQDLFATRSAGVQTTPSGTAGRLDAGALSFFPQGINAGTASAFGSSFHGGVTVADGGMTFTTGVSGNGLTVDNISVVKDLAVTRSAAIGTTVSGVAGDLAVSNALIVGSPTGGYQANSVNVAGSLLVNNVGTAVGSFCALSGCTMAGNIIMGGNNITGINSIGAVGLTVSGAAGISGGLTMGSGSSISGTGGLTMANGSFSSTLQLGGVGVTTGGPYLPLSGGTMTGQISMGNHSIIDINTTETDFITPNMASVITIGGGNLALGSNNITGVGDVASATLHISGASALHSVTIISGGLAVTGGLNVDNVGISGALQIGGVSTLGTGTVNVSTGVYLNGSAYTNP